MQAAPAVVPLQRLRLEAVFRRTAAATPNAMPNGTAMRVEKSASSAVAGAYLARSSAPATILERLSEVALQEVREVVQVLDGDRVVEPICSSNAATAAGSAAACSPRFAATGCGWVRAG